ncbi:S9 family peptidase [Rhizorhabdus wittichii]|uniref:S9 family peptidase n=1 Tax=Rhizorhabdus wittichii TaxID=160791 RepID=UPI0002F7E0DD|nr:prolyl oligopeptidase family serine peptidase [Rhizorhabdus wittichii]
MTKLLVRLFLLTWVMAGSPGLYARGFEASDSMNIVGMKHPQIAPDGARASIIVSKADIEANRFTAELRVVDTRTGQEILALDPAWEVSESRWAPDGQQLAIIAKRAGVKEAVAQIYVLDIKSPTPRQITQASDGIVQLAWAPDGKSVAYGREEALGLPKVDGKLVSFEVKERGYLATEPRKRIQLWIAQADGSGEKQLTRGNWTLQVPYKGSGPAILPFAWFPDGKSIVVATQAEPDVNSLERALRIVDVATGEVHSLLEPDARAINPVVSPDGREVAYWEYPRYGDAFSFSVRVVDVASRTVRASPPQPLDHNLSLARWFPKGGDILVGGDDSDRTSLWIQRRAAPPIKVDTGNLDLAMHFRVRADMSATGAIVFVASSPQSPFELYFMANANARPRRLTDYNAAARALELGSANMLRWRTHDGFEANGVVTVPYGFQANRRYPLVIVSHGGPMQASTLKWNSFTQELAARGWIVFEPNYRGSDNLGRNYQVAIVGDMGAGPARDVMAGLGELKRQFPIDADRIAVTGESYGGYMSAWLISHYQGWRAAVLGAPLLDTADFADLADVGDLAGSRFSGASPWEPGGQAVNQSQSPIYASAAVKTPTLFLTTTFDHRVPVVSSHRMFQALRQNKVETRFFIYPVEGHGTSDPARELDWNKRWMDWIAAHFDGAPGEKGK